jgi:HSP20 family protein
MAKKRSEPISFQVPLSHEVERLFDEMIHRPWGAGREVRGWNPSMDLYETADAFVLEADLPGVSAENVKVEVKDGDLVIQGQRLLDQSHHGEHFYILERSSGFFVRELTLPEAVDKEKITVELRQGVLRVILAKSKKTKDKNHASGGQNRRK